MNRVNYQKELDRLIDELSGQGRTPSLLLHSCCAPCSSYVLEYLSIYFKITVFYFNPNIFPAEEYHKRAEEQQRLIKAIVPKNPVCFLEGDYNPERFFDMSRGMENQPEGGERCKGCYELRLREAAEAAKKGKFDYFTTTLSISPMKNAEALNQIGEQLAREYGVHYLFSDFKKKGGYLRSIELSRQYGLYRQNYCGCIFSQQQAKANSAAFLNADK